MDIESEVSVLLLFMLIGMYWSFYGCAIFTTTDNKDDNVKLVFWYCIHRCLKTGVHSGWRKLQNQNFVDFNLWPYPSELKQFWSKLDFENYNTRLACAATGRVNYFQIYSPSA